MTNLEDFSSKDIATMNLSDFTEDSLAAFSLMVGAVTKEEFRSYLKLNGWKFCLKDNAQE